MPDASVVLAEVVRSGFVEGWLAERHSVLALDIVDPPLTRIQSIAWPAGTPLTPAADATRQCLQETVAALMERGVLQGRLPRHASHRQQPMD